MTFDKKLIMLIGLLFSIVRLAHSNASVFTRAKEFAKTAKAYTWDAQPFGIKHGGKIAVVGLKGLQGGLCYYLGSSYLTCDKIAKQGVVNQNDLQSFYFARNSALAFVGVVAVLGASYVKFKSY